MSISEERLKKFIGVIKANASAQADSIENEFKELSKSELACAEDEAIKESYKRAKEEQNSNSVKIAKEFSEKELNLKQEIYKKRQKIVDDIFLNATDNLNEFCKKPEYKAALTKGLKAVAEKFRGKKCIVELKECDMVFSDEISEIFWENCTVKPSDGIKIGGAYIEFPELSIIVDKTLDTLLADERKEFLENKEFALAE